MTSTYVNDLRLNEMATRDGSGTWGTTTNTNLELIGEALGYGTEAITTNADTHTTTVADGAADPGRAMYIKYTGTLDSTCTITIGPNTNCRVHFIENATSGSQSIIISQGSGANVTIPAGFVKAVYLDGAGSGAAVTEAFTDLSVGGNLLIDGATPTITLGDAGAEDTKIVFDGNAQDFYIGLDDSADDLVFGKGSTLGTTQAMAIDENMDVAFGPTTDVTITNDGNTDTLTLVSTDADATQGPSMAFYRNSSSPADSDDMGNIFFYGENDAGEKIEYGRVRSILLDASDGTEDSNIRFWTMAGGSLTDNLALVGGLVGIGTSTPGSYSAYADNLVVAGANQTGITIASADSSQSGLYFADGTSGAEQYAGDLDYNHSSNALAIGTNGATRLTISSAGTATFEHPIVTQSGATQGYYIENNAGNATTPRITNDANDHTVIRPGKSGGAVQWNNFANDAELMRLDDTGRLGIGATPKSWVSTWEVLQVGSRAAVTSQNGDVLQLSENTYNDGSSWKAVVAAAASLVYLDNGSIQFYHAPSVSADANQSFSEQMRVTADGLTFNGDTAAANALDDYEEGTWTPSLPNGGSISTNKATYTKIGRLVHAFCYIAVTPTNNSDQFNIGGLPYTAVATNYHSGGSLLYVSSADVTGTFGPLVMQDGTFVYFHRSDGTATSVRNNGVFQDTSQPIIISFTYEAQ